MQDSERTQFHEFVAARGPALFRVALALTGRRDAAEDLLQHALTETCARWRTVRQNPDGYVRRALYHAQVSAWRRRGRLREVPVEELPERPGADETAATDLRLALRTALARLGRRQRAVLVARFLEDLSEEQTAALLNVTVGTVRSQTHRALQRLRRTAPELSALHEPRPLPTEVVR
jgi:RNA polymerase sigma-70 factor (sigma-E family)